MSESPGATSTPVVQVYAAGMRDRLALSAWLVMFREMWDSRELIHRLIWRNLSGQFRQSFLGYLWITLPPIATAVIFALLRGANIMSVPLPSGGMPYAAFALLGTTIWSTFAQVATGTTNSISNAGGIVSKVYFPREVLVVSSLGNSLVLAAIRFAVVGLSFALLGYAPAWSAGFALLLMIPLVALAVGLGLIFAPINTMMHDMGRALEFIFQFGLFLCPAIYPTPSLTSGTPWATLIYWVHNLNPVSHLMQAMQDVVQQGYFVADRGFVVATAISFLVLLVGWRFFHMCEPLLAERL